MQILLANAKLMHSTARTEAWTEPMCQSTANALAMEMAQLDVDTLARELDCSRALAAENWQRYQQFHAAPLMPAILAYNGQAYKHLKAATLTDDDLRFAQSHLWITCFLYGLLRPMDGIAPYRMEHCVHLPLTGGKPIHQFWKDRLTDALLASVQGDDGVLIHLSTEEYEHLFDWERVQCEVRVVHPLFYVRQKDGRLKVQAVWAKSCRGAMVRFILQQRPANAEELQAFEYEGFRFSSEMGEADFPCFVREL